MEPADLNDGEVELLIGGLSDDVAFIWILIHLGLRGNPPTRPDETPSAADVNEAFGVLQRLSARGLIEVGRTEYIDGGPPGRVAPVRHVPEPLDDVHQRVLGSCATGDDWEWSCWVVNTSLGDAVARQALERR